LKLAQARAKSIGRADDARILLEDDFESGVRPTLSEACRETMAA
jgi:hypothetical protein